MSLGVSLLFKTKKEWSQLLCRGVIDRVDSANQNDQLNGTIVKITLVCFCHKTHAARAAMEDHGMTRMQELMSSYYGLNAKESRQDQERNIDSTGFDAKVYVKVRCCCCRQRSCQQLASGDICLSFIFVGATKHPQTQ